MLRTLETWNKARRTMLLLQIFNGYLDCDKFIASRLFSFIIVSIKVLYANTAEISVLLGTLDHQKYENTFCDENKHNPKTKCLLLRIFYQFLLMTGNNISQEIFFKCDYKSINILCW